MPVIGTPVGGISGPYISFVPAYTSSTGRDIATLTTILPSISQVFGRSIPTRMRAAAIKQAQTASIILQITDQNGDPIDLTSGGTLTIKGRFREVINPGSVRTSEIAGAFANAPGGYVSFTVPDSVAACSGIYYAEAGIYNSDAKLLTTNTIYLYVEPNLFGGSFGRTMFPLPSIQEARLKLRDSGPEENVILRDYEFDPAELCEALIWCVNYWNTSQPPIDIFFNTNNYPFYLHQGYVSFLMDLAGRRYMRNHLPYQAAGVSVDDQNKFQQYMQAAAQMKQEYMELVKHKKVQINCQMAMTSSGSGYGWYRPY